MEEDKFWIVVWSLAAAAFVVFVSVLAASSAYSDYNVRKMVERGSDPIKARCAIYGSGENNTAMCTIAVQK